MVSCPTNAISFKKSAMGVRVASVDRDKCINCGQCVKVCAQCTETELNSSSAVYAAWAKSDEHKSISSSGAIAPVLYENVISSGGTVFGATWQDGNVVIRSASAIEEIAAFCGSKYVESDVSLAIEKIKESIDRNREVLFIGLPCQVAAVKKLFKSDRLYTVDLICHGTPPREYFSEYLESLNIKNAKNVSFRGKDDFVLNVFNEEGEIEYSKAQYEEPYFKAFLDATIYKNCCYFCKYSRPERVSDITIGDFWGIDTESLTVKPNGKVSLVLINTDRGAQLFDRVKERVVFEPRELKEALLYNRQLSSPSRCDDERKKFETNYKKGGFVFALSKMSSTKQIKNRNKFFTKVKNKIKTIFGR